MEEDHSSKPEGEQESEAARVRKLAEFLGIDPQIIDRPGPQQLIRLYQQAQELVHQFDTANSKGGEWYTEKEQMQQIGRQHEAGLAFEHLSDLTPRELRRCLSAGECTAQLLEEITRGGAGKETITRDRVLQLSNRLLRFYGIRAVKIPDEELHLGEHYPSIPPPDTLGREETLDLMRKWAKEQGEQQKEE